VCQEAVSNAIRHSGADALVVEARVDDLRVWLRVADDGGGLPINMRAGIGLKSMKERLARLGGELELRAGNPRGVDLWACLPRKDRNIQGR
jgi:signal transduction histidine kinase